MHGGSILIEQASNGYVVRSAHRDPGYANGVLAVFNHLEDLAEWLRANFQLSDQENPT